MAPITPPNEDAEQRPAPILPPALRHTPTLRLHLNDLTSPVTTAFISAVNTQHLIPDALRHIIKHLYTPHGIAHIPAVRSVTLVLRPMGGVAYTTGLPLDDLHKEIHLSLHYLAARLPSPLPSHTTTPPPSFTHEILGVVLHELVHCYQHNCRGTAPGGLIEGIADYVRLKAGLAPPHWKKGTTEKEMGERWDEGYQKTAWFLEWLEKEKGRGSVGRMNEVMGRVTYSEGEGGLWEGLFGESVQRLWGRYKLTWKEHGEREEGECAGGEGVGDEGKEGDGGTVSRAGTEAEMVDLSLEEKEEADRG